MRNTDNGVIGSDQTAVMTRLALDELIDQLLHSNALSLKLTANPLVADRAGISLRIPASAPSPLTIHRPKSVRTTRCSFFISLACRPALASGCQSVSSAAFRDQKLHRV